MKKSFLLYLLINAILFFSCEDGLEPNKFDCPPPKESSFGSKIPFYHRYQKVSFDGEKLVFSGNKILYLKTGEILNLNDFLKSKLPSNVYLNGVGGYHWCPYDNNRILIEAVTGTDTVGDGKRYIYGQNLYIISIDGSQLKRITPEIYGQEGASSINVYAWLKESENEKDIIQLSSSDKRYLGQYLYIPQNNEFENTQVNNIFAFSNKVNIFTPFNYSFSLDYSNYFERIYSFDEYNNGFLLNRYPCKFNEDFELYRASWSPNTKYLALSVQPMDWKVVSEHNRRFNEIWIINFEKFLTDKLYFIELEKIINLRQNFCMYSGTIDAEFITDSTLAVSMYKDGDDFSFLWEITIDGKIVRQLTFEP